MTADVGSEEGLQRIWRRAVMPLLEEYFYARRNSHELLDSFEMDRLVPNAVGSAPVTPIGEVPSSA